MIQKETEVFEIPPNFNTTKTPIVIGQRLKIHGDVAVVHHIKKVEVTSGDNEPFIHYMISCDPLGHGWYYASKKEGGVCLL